MKFLSDVNVLLDVMLDRQPWSLDASQLFDEAARQGIVVVVSAIALPIVFYIARREAGRTTAYAAIDRLLAMTEIVAVDYQRLATARAMAGPILCNRQFR